MRTNAHLTLSHPDATHENTHTQKNTSTFHYDFAATTPLPTTKKHTIVNKNNFINSVWNSKWIGEVTHLFYSFLATPHPEKIGVLFGVLFLLRIQKKISFRRNFTIPITLRSLHTIFLHKFEILLSESLYSSIGRSSKVQWYAFWCILVYFFYFGSKN